jgi:hypothetical protein
MDVKLRSLNPDTDVEFLLSSWLKSYKNSEFAREIPKAIYYKCHQNLIATILKAPDTAVAMLVNKNDEDQILGYIVHDKKQPIIHYVYMKRMFRNLKLAKFMLDQVKSIYKKDLPIMCTHKGKNWSKLSKKFNLLYTPYL